MKQKIKLVTVQIRNKEKIETLRCTQTFLERWKWELEKRKEVLWLSRFANSYCLQSTETVKLHVSEIDPSLLTHPVVTKQ